MKPSLLITMSLLLAISAFSQKTTYYQLKFKGIDDGFEFQSNRERDVFIRLSKPSRQIYKFILTDYNTVLYTPIVKVTAKRFKSVMPEGLKSYLAMADLDRDSDFIRPNLPPANLKIDVPEAIEEELEELKNINERIDLINKRIARINDHLWSNEANNAKSLADEKKGIDTQMIELKSRQAYLEGRLRHFHIIRTIENFREAYEKAIGVEANFTWLMKALEEDKESISRCKELRDSIRTKVMGIMHLQSNQSLSDFHREFNRSLYTCTALKESLAQQLGSGTVVNDESVLTAIDEAFIASESVESRKTALAEMVKSFTRLFPKKECIESAAYKHKYDYALLDIKLVDNLNPKDTVVRQQVKVLTKGGVDVDFAIGLAYNNIFKRSWYVDTVGTGSIKEERITRLDITWAALINVSVRVGPNARAGVSAGPGISLIDGDPRYLFGLHYLWGRRDMLGLSAGLCVGKKNFLPSVVSEDGKNPNDNLPAELTSVTPYTKYASGLYVGIFYNFSRK